jgi:RNA polymerase sigma factor (TIGR02999 family)
MAVHNEVTQILLDWSQGDQAAPARLMPLVYEELRELARHHLRHERTDHTLQPTALVHEAYVRLLGSEKMGGQGRSHFFGAAARAMRRILIEHARAAAAEKRGGGEARKIYLDETAELAQPEPLDVLELDEALNNLAEHHARQGEVVELKFFGGLNTREISEVLGVSEKTVVRDWQFAKLWLCRALSDAKV